MPRFAALALLLGVISHAWAEPQRWYQVELLVFAQPGTTSPESWPAIPALSYPSPARFLVNPTQVSQVRAEYGASASIDRFGRLVIDHTAPPSPGVTTGQPDIPEPPASTPFELLPRGELEFRDKAAYMASRGGYRILFHEAWRQPVAGQKTSVPILLDRSGDGGPWPELQGSIRLFLSRYLHLETNLWLNTAGGYLPGEWRMPAPPLSPQSLIVIRDEPAAETSGQTLEEEKAEAAAPAYPFRHAVQLQQKRRMRSNEVHYLDHPLFGLVIKITPLETDEAVAAPVEAL